MIDPWNKAILAMDLTSKHTGPPRGATICSVVKLGTETIIINCAGFKRSFPDVPAAARYLDISWEYLGSCMERSRDVLFLVRKDHLDPWHSTRK